jgi:TPR repeat protein
MAQLSFAHCLASGEGASENARLAAAYFEKAADQGNDEAQMNYSACLSDGIGVSRNVARRLLF